MNTPFEIIKRPIITEKSTAGEGMEYPQYTFQARRDATKSDIRAAVETAWNVKVRSVNTMNCLGKMKRVRVHPGRRPSWKKAIVTLEKGQTIDLY